jgi:hypothetical protein
MEEKKIGDITVNNGKGLFDNEGLCDTILNDLNNLFRQLMNGQYLTACTVATNMAQKLINLKQGIKNDTESLKSNIEELKRMNDSLMEQQTGLPVEKDGAENGNN